MKTFVIEREIPGASKLTTDQLKGIALWWCSIGKLSVMGGG